MPTNYSGGKQLRCATGSKKKLNLPRAPLPKQIGGVHKVKTKIKLRKAKHKKPGSHADVVVDDFFDSCYDV